jgi:hypothetical protein
MLTRNKPVVTNRFAFLKELVEKYAKPVVTAAILHPGKREQGVSFNRREQMRRNKTQYGKRQIRIEITDAYFMVTRDFHMPIELWKKPIEYSLHVDTLASYQHALFTSGYRLLSATPTKLIYQYEGRIH